MDRRIVLLCGVNGVGKSTLAELIQKVLKYEIVDVDKSNFDTSKKVEKYYQYFLNYLKVKETELSMKEFKSQFTFLYDGECNKDASLTLLTMCEKITGTKIQKERREYEIDHLYKEVLAPVYREDTEANILEAFTKNLMCIDIGSRKFFFVDDSFISFLEKMGYRVEVIYLNLDFKKNIANLFNIKDGKYVIFDRLNLTGVIKDVLNLHQEYKDLSQRLTSKNPQERERAFKEATALLKSQEKLKAEAETAIGEYMTVRRETLGEHLLHLKKGKHQEIVHELLIGAKDTPESIFKQTTVLLTGETTTPVYTPLSQLAPKISSGGSDLSCTSQEETVAISKSPTVVPVITPPITTHPKDLTSLTTKFALLVGSGKQEGDLLAGSGKQEGGIII